MSIVRDDDSCVGFRLLRALLVGERIVQSEIYSFPAVDTENDSGGNVRKAMAEIVIMLVFFGYNFNFLQYGFFLCEWPASAFKSRLTTTLCCSRCPPRRRVPLANSP